MIQIFDCDQNSPEWFDARKGLPTASRFSDVLAKGEGKTRRKYMLTLAGEILTGQPAESYSNGFIERGHTMEPEARRIYAFMYDAEPRQVGFIRNGAKGCSPDSLLGDDGLLEIKTQKADLLIDTLLKGSFPAEYVAQCQGALWVSERDWLDIAVYWPGLPLFVRRATRDEAYIANLSAEVDRFNDELAALVEKVRRYGEPQASLSSQLHASVGAAA